MSLLTAHGVPWIVFLVGECFLVCDLLHTADDATVLTSCGWPWMVYDCLVFTNSRDWIFCLWSMSGSRVESLWAFVIMFSRLDNLYKVYPFQALRSDPILLIFHHLVLKYTSCLLIIESWSTVRASSDIFSPAWYEGSDDWCELSSVQVLNPIKHLLVFLFNVSIHYIVYNCWMISPFIRASTSSPVFECNQWVAYHCPIWKSQLSNKDDGMIVFSCCCLLSCVHCC